MARGIVAAVICVVLIAVGFLPVVAGSEHIVIKGDMNPKSSELTWSFTAPETGQYSWRIDNFGLKWMTFQVFDNATGIPVEISRERIRFAAVDAYPTGMVLTSPVILAKDHVCDITVTPNGPRGAYAIVTDPLPSEPPVAFFTMTAVDDTVWVDASGSYDLDGVIVSYFWNWGDGTTGEGVNATHTYIPGTYTLTLTVTDNDGQTGTVSHFITWDGWPPLPVAHFQLAIESSDWDTVHADGSTSYSPNGPIVSYAWDFGDGYTATGVTADHTYASTGSFLITLTITDSIGLQDSVQGWVQISPVWVVFYVTIVDYTVTADASSIDTTGTIVSYAWDWGDGTTASGTVVTHTYAEAGTYIISLVVTDNEGKTTGVSMVVTVPNT